MLSVISEAVDALTKFSVPLYVNDDYGRPQQYGTGFFVRANQSDFLVSAAHVLDIARTRNVFFYSKPDTLRWLTGPVITTGHPDQRANDKLDIGVMRLTGDATPPYPEVDKFPMPVSYLKPRYLPRADKHYVIVGFPATKSLVDTSRRVTLSTPHAYRSDSMADEEYEAAGVDPSTHIALPLDLKRGGESRRTESPLPQAPRNERVSYRGAL